MQQYSLVRHCQVLHCQVRQCLVRQCQVLHFQRPLCRPNSMTVRHKWMRPALTPVRYAFPYARFICVRGMESWVDLGNRLQCGHAICDGQFDFAEYINVVKVRLTVRDLQASGSVLREQWLHSIQWKVRIKAWFKIVFE